MMARRNMQQHSAALRPAAGRWLAPAIGVTAVLWGLVFGPAQAQQFLACGVPVAHHLASGETDTYQPAVSGGVSTVVDVTDTSGSIGLLQLSPVGCSPPCAPPTCSGSADFTGPVAVTDCVGNDAGDYTIEFNVVAQSPENCGIALSCGVAPANTALNVPGQIDAYTFVGVADQHISVAASATSDATGALRMRLFSPSGDLQSDSCSGALAFDVPGNGTYTVLVSACVTPSTGPYTIVWQTQPACASAPPAAFAYVTVAGAGTVGVIDLATNRLVSIAPTLVPVTNVENQVSAITANPNNGLVYASFDSGTVSVINTTLNRQTGSINLPISALGGGLRLAVDPEGRYAYADTLPGLAVINLTTLKTEAVIPLENINIPALAPIAVSPDGKFVYVPAFTAKQLTPVETYRLELIVIATASRTVVGRLTLDENFHQIVGVSDPRFVLDVSLNSTGTLAYVTDSDTLYVVDTATRTVTRSLPLPDTSVGFSDVVLSPDGHVAYAVSTDPGVLVIDLDSLTITTTIPVANQLLGQETGGAALSPDGGRLVVTNRDAGADPSTPAAIVIDTRTSQVIATIPGFGSGPSAVAIVTPPSGLCTADDSGQTRVTVGELVSSVNYAADGCPTTRTNRSAVP